MIRFLCASRPKFPASGVGVPSARYLGGGLHGTYATLAAAGDSNGREKVKAGIALYQSGQYGAAARRSPRRNRICPRNRGSRWIERRRSARQARANRRSVVPKAAATAEPEVASAAHYNLACLATHADSSGVGSQPEEAPPAARERCLRLLDEAESEDRACLQLDANAADARYNLEVILLWRPRMQQAWQKRDRQPDRGPPPSKVEQPHSHPKQRGGESQQNPEREPDRPGKSGPVRHAQAKAAGTGGRARCGSITRGA